MTFADILVLCAGPVPLPFPTHTHSLLSRQSFHIGKQTFNFCLSESDLVHQEQCSPVPVSLCRSLGLILYGQFSIEGKFILFSLSTLLLVIRNIPDDSCDWWENETGRTAGISSEYLLHSVWIHTPSWESCLLRQLYFKLFEDSLFCFLCGFTPLHPCLQCTKVLSLHILFNICCTLCFDKQPF